MLLALALASTLVALTNVPPPATPKKPVVDERFGDKVSDDYRWLEDWNDKAVQQWSDAQNVRARKMLDALPGRAAIEKRVTQLLSFESPSYRAVVPRAGVFFALKQQPPKQQPFLVVIASLTDPASERVLVDPNALDATGGTSIDFWNPSPDGKRIAVSLSQGGSESGVVHVFDVATGKDLDSVPRANSGTAGGTLAWKHDGSGFWYTRHPHKPEVGDDDDGFFQQVAFHTIGTSADAVELGAVTGGKREDLVRTSENFLEASDDGRFVSDIVQKGDGGEFELWLRATTRASKWRKLARFEDRVVAARFASDGTLYLLSRKDDAGRGSILALAPTASSLEQARVIVAPSADASIESLEVTAKHLWIVEQLGGPSRLRSLSLASSASVDVPILAVSSVSGVVRTSGDGVLFENQSFTVPSAWFSADASGAVTPTFLAQKAPVAMSDVDVTRVEATSKDGTQVPMSILRIKATKVGDAPTLLTGYGGFGISTSPAFSKGSRAWLEQGGVVALCNMRGGGERGDAWHRAGMKTHKQNVFDDFLACAERLTSGADRVTTTAHLAIQGGSNGGLLMGAALTQRPELFHAVVALVGYFDMLRYETKPNGAFNNAEYGSVANEDEYRALKAYSPYHAVKDGTRYPPTLFMTGANDPRVDPLHSRKMVARLQAAGAQAMLRTSGGTGHGGGTPLSARIAETVDVDAFLFDALGVTYKSPE